MPFLDFLNTGLLQSDAALFVNRIIVGMFFALSGYHKLFNSERHAVLVETLRSRNIPFLGFNQWFVPLVEFFGGLAVVSGFLAPLAAFGMIAILMVALVTNGQERISAYNPINAGDALCDALYLPEVLYLIMLVVVIIAGPGAYGLHELLPSML